MNIDIPEDFVFKVSVEEILGKVLDPESFLVMGEGPVTRKVQRYAGARRLRRSSWGNSWQSKYEDTYETIEVTSWWYREDELFVVCENTPMEEILGEGHRLGVAGEIGVTEDMITKAREWLEAKKSEAENAYRISVAVPFAQSLCSSQEYSVLCRKARLEIEALYGWRALYPTRIAENIREEWDKATESLQNGVLRNVEIWSRTGGRTKAGNGWVIGPDGQERKPTSWNLERRHQGFMVWEEILPEELVLKWSKSNSAAPHEFEVLHLPEGGLTEAQLDRILEIEDEIELEWKDARGFSSGDPSPSIGNGWGLIPEGFAEPIVESEPEAEECVEEESPLASEDDLQSLKDLFG